jgi:hypothetical protein
MARHGILLAAFALLLAACGPRDMVGETRRETHSIPLDNSELTRVNVNMHAGELRIAGGAGQLMDAEFTYNVASWKPQVEHRSTGTRGDLDVIQPPGVHLAVPDGQNRWDLRLNDGALIDLVARMGAGEARLDLGTLSLRAVDLDIGVGEVAVDLRGTPRRSYDVRINGGVGQATVYLPSTVAINATATGGIGNIDVSGLENRNGRWINPDAENSPVTIRVDVKGGIGEIRLIAQ